LLTHQPPSWLTLQALADLRGEIDEPGKFAAHMFGHMHDMRYTSLGEGGSEPRRYWQASSLFGLEKFVNGPLLMSREHGYCAGRLEIVDANAAQLSFWPRKACKRQDGTLGLGPDVTCKLLADGRTPPVSVPLLKPAPPQAISLPKNTP